MGRSSFVMVLGFSTALFMIGSNITKVSNAAVDNYTYYHNSELAHTIAGAGMNMASRAIYENPLWRSGFSNKSFNGGQFNVKVVDLGGNRVQMTSTGTFSGTSRVVSCVLQPSSFSRYNYYSSNDQNGYWITGDTVWGPFHCNNWLNVAGTPVFMQRATSRHGINNYQNQAHPVFKGGFDKCVDVNLPADLQPLKTAANEGGKWLQSSGGNKLVFVQFNSDGTVTWRIDGNLDWSGGGWTTEPLTSFAPNGAIWCNENNLHIKGVLNGRVTIGSTKYVWIDGDITYAADPRHGYSDDMLGLVAEDKLWISDNAENRGPNNDFTLMGSVFSRVDGIWAENYATRPVEGKMTTVGGQIQKIGGYTGVFSGNPPTVVHGFKPGGTFYDDRLMNDAPPFFPTTGNFEVVSWFE